MSARVRGLGAGALVAGAVALGGPIMFAGSAQATGSPTCTAWVEPNGHVLATIDVGASGSSWVHAAGAWIDNTGHQGPSQLSTYYTATSYGAQIEWDQWTGLDATYQLTMQLTDTNGNGTNQPSCVTQLSLDSSSNYPPDPASTTTTTAAPTTTTTAAPTTTTTAAPTTTTSAPTTSTTAADSTTTTAQTVQIDGMSSKDWGAGFLLLGLLTGSVVGIGVMRSGD